MSLRDVLFLILLLASCHCNLAYDSVIIEAAKANRNFASQNANLLVQNSHKWEPNDIVLVRPYNILEVSCPIGYVLANKHCHRRVRIASTVQ